MGYHLTTDRGYDFFEAASAMQKEIRRGDEEAALYWALELESKFHDFVWNRLAIIASEDIGPADNSIAVLIHALHDQYLKTKKKGSGKPSERIFLAHAIAAMCRAKKSRVADNLWCLVAHQVADEGLKREVPDYALDFHTRKGKTAGRSWDHWDQEGCKIENEAPRLDVYHDRALEMRRKYGRLKSKTTTSETPGDLPLLDETGGRK